MNNIGDEMSNEYMNRVYQKDFRSELLNSNNNDQNLMFNRIVR